MRCTGAYIFWHQQGLMDGRKCSIHWNDAHTFGRIFPQVSVVADQVITKEHGLAQAAARFLYEPGLFTGKTL